MSYYSSHSDTSWWTVIICFVLVFLIMFGFNTCTYAEWNNGICPECHTRYELRGVSKYMKYYACPDCGNEVERY
jgi:hypothetical protein